MVALNTYIIDPLREVMTQVASVIPTLMNAILVLILLIAGIALLKIVRDAIHRLLKEVHTDKFADKILLSDFLSKGGLKHSVSDLISSLFYFIFVVMFLVVILKIMGVAISMGSIDMLMAYVPGVVSAVIVLALGLIIAKIAGVFVHLIASNVGVGNPKLLERITRWAVILYVIRISLTELGYGFLFSGMIFQILFAGIVLGLALAFGLGGKDMAADFLKHKK